MQNTRPNRQESFADPPFTVSAPLTRLIDGTVLADDDHVACHECGTRLADGDTLTLWLIRSPVWPDWDIARLLCHDAPADDPFQRGQWQATVTGTIGIRSVATAQRSTAVLVTPTIDRLSPPRSTTGHDPETVVISPQRWIAAVKHPNRDTDDDHVTCPYCGTDTGITAMADPGRVRLDCGHRTAVRTTPLEESR